MNTPLAIKKLLPVLVTSVFFITSSIYTYAQSQTITGVVTSDADNKPLQGVSLQVKGKLSGTSTDAKGQYSIKNISSSDSILFSFVGFQSKTVANNTSINTSLQPQALSLYQVVVVGYGTQKKSDRQYYLAE